MSFKLLNIIFKLDILFKRNRRRGYIAREAIKEKRKTNNIMLKRRSNKLNLQELKKCP
jgi:hypothetical protein